MTLASRLGSIVVCTGEKDYVTDGTRVIAVENGDVLMTKVTAVGCALSSGGLWAWGAAARAPTLRTRLSVSARTPSASEAHPLCFVLGRTSGLTCFGWLLPPCTLEIPRYHDITTVFPVRDVGKLCARTVCPFSALAAPSGAVHFADWLPYVTRL